MQGEATEIYNKEGQVSADELLNTPANQLACITNVDVENASKWFVPGKNTTEGRSQKQTNDLLFGYKGNNTDGSIQKFQRRSLAACTRLASQVGSWCTQFPCSWSPYLVHNTNKYQLRVLQPTNRPAREPNIPGSCHGQRCTAGRHSR